MVLIKRINIKENAYILACFSVFTVLIFRTIEYTNYLRFSDLRGVETFFIGLMYFSALWILEGFKPGKWKYRFLNIVLLIIISSVLNAIYESVINYRSSLYFYFLGISYLRFSLAAILTIALLWLSDKLRNYRNK